MYLLDRDIDGLMNESFKFCTHLEKASPVVLQEELDINFDFPHVNDVIWTQVFTIIYSHWFFIILIVVFSI